MRVCRIPFLLRFALRSSAVMLLAIPARAQTLTTSNISTRVNNHTLTFANLTFAGATDSGTNTLSMSGAVNNQSGGFTTTVRSANQAFSTNSGSGIQLTNIVPPSSANAYTASFTATVVNASDPTQSWFSFNQSYPAVPASAGFTASTLVAAVTNGFNTLEFQCCGQNLLAVGGTYIADISIPGNWSALGSGVGEAQLLANLNAGWTITQYFVYNAQTDSTLFEAVNGNYTRGSVPGIDILLTGLPSGASPPTAPTVLNTYALREEITANDVNLNAGLAGDMIQVGAYCITFVTGTGQCTSAGAAADANLAADAYNVTTIVPLQSAQDAINPDHLDMLTPYSASLTGPWTFELYNKNSCQSNCTNFYPNYAANLYPVNTVTTLDLTAAQTVPFPHNVTNTPDSSSAAVPTFSWNEPASFSALGNAAAVRVQIWNPIGGAGGTPLQILATPSNQFSRGQTGYSYTVPASFTTNNHTYTLASGQKYVLEIQNLVLRDPTNPSSANPNVLSRSRAFFDFYPGTVADLPPNVTSYVLPNVTLNQNPGGAPTYSFLVNGVPTQSQIFVDPAIAIGYTFTAGAGDPNFASVTVPAVTGSNYVLANVQTSGPDLDSGTSLTPNVQYTFKSGGVSSFQVLGVNPSAALDPTNPSAFVTGLSWVSNGNFTGTMVPVLQPAVTDSASTVVYGGTSTLSVIVSGSGPFTYQWFQGSSGDTSRPIAGATVSSYTTPALTATTSYWVQVINAAGTPENSSTVTITVTGGGSGSDAAPTDGPLPLWALMALGAGLVGLGSRRLRKPA